MWGGVSNCPCLPLLAEMGFPGHATSSFHTGKVLGKPGWVVTLCGVDLTVNFSVILPSIKQLKFCVFLNFLYSTAWTCSSNPGFMSADSVNSWHSLSRKCLQNAFRMRLTPFSVFCVFADWLRGWAEKDGAPPVPTSSLPPPSSAKASSLLPAQRNVLQLKIF